MSKYSHTRHSEHDYERYDDDSKDSRSDDEAHKYHSNRSLTRMQPQNQSPDYKRLIICCDGTWVDANAPPSHGKIEPPSNVSRLTRAIRSSTTDGTPQIVYYQAGVGSIGNVTNKVIGGATGEGLAENVREAYSFIANNYNRGDEIFLIGFSRGAFTARSVGGLIGNIGVLTKAGLASFPIIYRDFKHRFERGYRSPLRDVPFRDKPSARSPEYARELERRRLTTLGVRIKAIGVWDTVGSLGVPRVEWLGRFGKKTTTDMSEYKFYDTTLDECVENAFQALALDERRASFQPAVWEKRNNRTTNLIQVWFPGVHANVGGGYNDQELANITLAWMMAMLNPLLELGLEYILDEEKANAEYYDRKGRGPAPWSFGKIYNSDTGAFKAAGKVVRTPGDYYRLDPQTGEATNKPLRDTNEYIHSAVRARFAMEGPGQAGKGIYTPPALKGWRLDSEPDIDGLPTPWFWQQREGQDRIILPEAPLRAVEKKLLEQSPDVDEYVSEPPPPKRRR